MGVIFRGNRPMSPGAVRPQARVRVARAGVARGLAALAIAGALGGLAAPAHAGWPLPFGWGESTPQTATAGPSRSVSAQNSAPAGYSARSDSHSEAATGLAAARPETAPAGHAWAEGGWPEWNAGNWMSVAFDAPNALGLRAAQIQKWEAAQAKTREGREEILKRQEAYQAQLREMAKKGAAPLDPVALARSRRALAIQREQTNQASEESWIDFYSSLDSEQQAKFKELARDRIQRWGDRAKMARRWDAK